MFHSQLALFIPYISFEMKKNNESSSSFPIGETAQEKRYSHAPECYKLQPFDRPRPNTEIADIPIIDMEGMCDDPMRRIKVVQDIGNACKLSGFFQVSLKFSL